MKNKKNIIIITISIIILLILVLFLIHSKSQLENFKIISFYQLTGENDKNYLIEYEKNPNAIKYQIEIFDSNNKKIFEKKTMNDLLVFQNKDINIDKEYEVKICAYSKMNAKKCQTKKFNNIKSFINNDYVCTNVVSSNTYNEEISKKIIDTAKQYLGIPFYLNNLIKDENAKNPKDKYAGIDCCGFANAVYESVFNKEVADKPGDMAYETRNKCVAPNDIKPGDMVFWIDFNNEREFKKYGRVFHIGIYVGNNRVIEATRNATWGYKGVTYSDLYRERGNTFLAMITRPYA